MIDFLNRSNMEEKAQHMAGDMEEELFCILLWVFGLQSYPENFPLQTQILSISEIWNL